MEMYVVIDYNRFDCVVGIFSSEEKVKKAILEEWEEADKDSFNSFEEFIENYEIRKKTLDKRYVMRYN